VIDKPLIIAQMALGGAGGNLIACGHIIGGICIIIASAAIGWKGWGL